jgi:hypothetical protein
VKSRDFWTSKPRKRHDGRQGEGCRGSKEIRKTVGSRWRGEVRRRLGCGGEETKKWDFPHDHDPQKGRHPGALPYQNRSVLNKKARPSLDFAHKLVATCLACLCCTQSLYSSVSTHSAHSKWVLSDPTTRPLKAPSSLIKRRESLSPSALRTYRMAHTAAKVGRPDF